MPQPPRPVGIDPTLAAALATQLAHWRAALAGGAQRVGWKLGMGQRERVGGQLAVGHLTSATRLEPGATYHPDSRPHARLHADAEVALLLGQAPDAGADPAAAGQAVAGVGVALELVDLAGPPDDAAWAVATNVFHRAVAFGPLHPALPAGGVRARLLVNGQVVASAPAPDLADLTGRVGAAARLLAAVGERLQAGDRIITGSVVQVPIIPGDEVTADMGALGVVRLSIGA
jgi:2-keto-4-pentenoate hydratase